LSINFDSFDYINISLISRKFFIVLVLLYISNAAIIPVRNFLWLFVFMKKAPHLLVPKKDALKCYFTDSFLGMKALF